MRLGLFRITNNPDPNKRQLFIGPTPKPMLITRRGETPTLNQISSPVLPNRRSKKLCNEYLMRLIGSFSVLLSACCYLANFVGEFPLAHWFRIHLYDELAADKSAGRFICRTVANLQGASAPGCHSRMKGLRISKNPNLPRL